MTMTEIFLLDRLLSNTMLLSGVIDGRDLVLVKFASISEETIVVELIKRSPDAREYTENYLRSCIANFGQLIIDRTRSNGNTSIPRIEVLLIQD